MILYACTHVYNYLAVFQHPYEVLTVDYDYAPRNDLDIHA